MEYICQLLTLEEISLFRWPYLMSYLTKIKKVGKSLRRKITFTGNSFWSTFKWKATDLSTLKEEKRVAISTWRIETIWKRSVRPFLLLHTTINIHFKSLIDKCIWFIENFQSRLEVDCQRQWMTMTELREQDVETTKMPYTDQGNSHCV